MKALLTVVAMGCFAVGFCALILCKFIKAVQHFEEESVRHGAWWEFNLDKVVLGISAVFIGLALLLLLVVVPRL